MKLSKLETGKACDVMADLIIPIANICENEKVVNSLKILANDIKKDYTVAEIAIKFIKISVPEILKTNKKDLFEVVGILTERSVEEVDAQNLFKTLKDIKEIVDEDLIELFKSPTITEQAE